MSYTSSIACYPLCRCAVKVIHFDMPGEWKYGVRFGYGRGRSFNTYTRYYLRDLKSGETLWEGWHEGAPDPMDPSERRGVEDFLIQNTRVRRWIQRKIEAQLTK